MALILLMTVMQVWQTRQIADTMANAVTQLATNQLLMAAELKTITARLDAPPQGIGDVPREDL